MKPQQLAALLNIAPNTLRRWAGKDYAEFLSPNAQGANGAHRSFSERDARIIAWVALMKAQNTSANDIHATLKSAQAEGWKNLPPLPGGIANDEPIAVVPREAVEERVRALQERYEMQLQSIVKERDELRAKLDSLQQESSETIKNLQQRIINLTAQEAELRGKLEQYVIGGQRRSAVTLVALALLVGIVVMGVAVLLALLATSLANAPH